MTVVLGYDESPGADEALRVAIDVAKRFGEPLRLVYGAAPPGGLGEEFKAHQEALAEIGQQATGHALERAAAGGGRDATVDVVQAKPAEALLQVAEECGARRRGDRGRHLRGEPDQGRHARLDPAQAAAAELAPGAVRARRLSSREQHAQAMSAGLRDQQLGVAVLGEPGRRPAWPAGR